MEAAEALPSLHMSKCQIVGNLMARHNYTTYISLDLAHHEIFCAKVGTGGIMKNK